MSANICEFEKILETCDLIYRRPWIYDDSHRVFVGRYGRKPGVDPLPSKIKTKEENVMPRFEQDGLASASSSFPNLARDRGYMRDHTRNIVRDKETGEYKEYIGLVVNKELTF